MDQSLRTVASIASLEPSQKALDIVSINPAPPLPDEPRKILVTLLSPIGDTLLSTPALHALRKRFPYAEITGLTYRSNYGILEGNPDLNHLVQLNPAGAGPEWIQIGR